MYIEHFCALADANDAKADMIDDLRAQIAILKEGPSGTTNKLAGYSEAEISILIANLEDMEKIIHAKSVRNDHLEAQVAILSKKCDEKDDTIRKLNGKLASFIQEVVIATGKREWNSLK